MSKPGPFRPFLHRGVAAAILAVALTTNCLAATLYEDSLAILQARAAKASPRDFTFVVLGDSRDNDPVFRKTLALAKSYAPLFILHGGDYSGTGSDRETANFLTILKEEVPGIPFFVVRGNHEQRQIFTREVAPLDYTLDLPRLDMRLVVADNSDYAVSPATLNYLRKQLGANRRFTFAALHVPPKTRRWNWHTFSDGADSLGALLADNRVNMAFYGHVHLYDRDEIRGVPSIISGGAGAPLVKFGFPGEAVYHLVVVRVKDGTVSATMVPVMK